MPLDRDVISLPAALMRAMASRVFSIAVAM